MMNVFFETDNFFDGLACISETVRYYIAAACFVALLWYVLFKTFTKILEKFYSSVCRIIILESVCDMSVFWNCSKKQKRAISKILQELPPAMCFTFGSMGYRLSFLDHDVYVSGPDRRVAVSSVGLFSPASKMIFIDADRDLTEIKDTLYHEFGHFCDWIAGNGQVYGSDLNGETLQLYFDSLYNEEIPDYYRSNVREFVAYCASHFYCEPSRLSTKMLAVGQSCFQYSFRKANDLANVTGHT